MSIIFPLNSFQCDGASWRLHAGVVPARRVAMDTSLICLKCSLTHCQPVRHQFPSSSIGAEFNTLQVKKGECVEGEGSTFNSTCSNRFVTWGVSSTSNSPDRYWRSNSAFSPTYDEIMRFIWNVNKLNHKFREQVRLQTLTKPCQRLQT